MTDYEFEIKIPDTEDEAMRKMRHMAHMERYARIVNLVLPSLSSSHPNMQASELAQSKDGMSREAFDEMLDKLIGLEELADTEL